MSEVDKTPVASAVIPVAVPAAVPMSEQEKLGAKCCEFLIVVMHR